VPNRRAVSLAKARRRRTAQTTSALIALPPAVLVPSGEIELVATGAATLLACVLVALICYESLRR